MEKLSLFLDDKPEKVEQALIDQVAGAVENAHVGQFVEALSARDRKGAIHTLVEIHHQGHAALCNKPDQQYKGCYF